MVLVIYCPQTGNAYFMCTDFVASGCFFFSIKLLIYCNDSNICFFCVWGGGGELGGFFFLEGGGGSARELLPLKYPR